MEFSIERDAQNDVLGDSMAEPKFEVQINTNKIVGYNRFSGYSITSVSSDVSDNNDESRIRQVLSRRLDGQESRSVEHRRKINDHYQEGHVKWQKELSESKEPQGLLTISIRSRRDLVSIRRLLSWLRFMSTPMGRTPIQTIRPSVKSGCLRRFDPSVRKIKKRSWLASGPFFLLGLHGLVDFSILILLTTAISLRQLWIRRIV
jgi:hypothetical protein